MNEKIIQELSDNYHSDKTVIAHVKFEVNPYYWDNCNQIRIKVKFLDGILEGKTLEGDIDVADS